MILKSAKCPPDEVAIKSLFLGPSAENADWLEGLLRQIFQSWYAWRKQINVKDGRVISEEDQLLDAFIAQQEHTTKVISEIVKMFENELPKFSPRYIGHMFSEISMPALLGHFITLLHNPNNISPEASFVGTEMEIEAIGLLKKIVGYNAGVGHFTSGGTVANFEFLFRARERMARWLATGVAFGNCNLIESAHMGWNKFSQIDKNTSKADVQKFYVLNGGRDAYNQILKKTNSVLGEPLLLVSASKHYSWPKAMHLLGLGESNIGYIELDQNGRACAKSLKKEIQSAIKGCRPILGVVAIVGTTELGTVDPVDSISSVLQEFRNNEGYDIWLHVDGAYGGFMGSLVNDPVTKCESVVSDALESSLKAIAMSDSITLDPHKLGYVPYSSGAFICQDQKNYFMRSFTGPYIVSEEKNIGNYTLEGSRSAAGAVATYASIKSFDSSGGYKKLLKRTIQAKKDFEGKIRKLNFNVFIPQGLDTNILCFAPIGNVKTLNEMNQLTLTLYSRIQESREYWISKTTLNKHYFDKLISQLSISERIECNCENLELLRLTLMNPFTVSKEGAVDHISSFCTMLGSEFAKLNQAQ